MLKIKGTYNTAQVFTDELEQSAHEQVLELCNQEFSKGSIIRIMPDAHAGAGCVIGTTMTITDKVVPNLVGVDIGCGMLTVPIPDDAKVKLDELDNYIRRSIPHGFYNNKVAQYDFIESISSIKCLPKLSKPAKDFNLAIGSLGGGNHFIEIDVAPNGERFLVIHSGSRNIGLQIANYYQEVAYHHVLSLATGIFASADDLINSYKADGRHQEIAEALKTLKSQWKIGQNNIKKALSYLEMEDMQDYLHDMKVAQVYAKKNRETMAQRIFNQCFALPYDPEEDGFHTVHNYIDDNNLLRKGAVSAKEGEILLVPINMRDGSLLCMGKGNKDWNESAPHGAGRLMSRTEANNTLSLEEFENSMEGVYTSCVGKKTLDESPMAYKSMGHIVNNTADTMDIIDVLKPIYNFKAQ